MFRFLENVVLVLVLILVRARFNEKKAKRWKQQDVKNVVYTASPLFLMMLINVKMKIKAFISTSNARTFSVEKLNLLTHNMYVDNLD